MCDEGQETDAYLMEDAVDPSAMMAMVNKEKVFVPKEGIRDELFLTKDDCRAYCISVPGDEFMTYAKAMRDLMREAGMPGAVLTRVE